MIRLKELRDEKNISQLQLASAIDTNQSTIGRWEKGLISPSIEYVEKLSNYFGCSIDYLVGRSDDFGNINTNADLSAEESEIIETFRSLTSERDKTLFLLFVRNMQSDSFLKKYHKKES